MGKVLLSYLLQAISLIPAFTVIGTFTGSFAVLFCATVFYYIVSAKLLPGPCALLNMVLWPIGFIISFSWHWAYSIFYASAFAVLWFGAKHKGKE